MDPLSIVASVLALVTAAGKTSEGLQRAWELRRIDEDFTGLVNVVCSSDHDDFLLNQYILVRSQV